MTEKTSKAINLDGDCPEHTLLFSRPVPDIGMDISSCIPKFDLEKMDKPFWQKVCALRDGLSASLYLKINSAYRSKNHEYSRGRSGNSQHCLGRAVDISCCSNSARWLIVSKAIELNFHRILIYPTFIHLDDKAGVFHHILWMQK